MKKTMFFVFLIIWGISMAIISIGTAALIVYSFIMGVEKTCAEIDLISVIPAIVVCAMTWFNLFKREFKLPFCDYA